MQMNVLEKLQWFYRTHGIRALVLRVVQRLLFPSSRMAPVAVPAGVEATPAPRPLATSGIEAADAMVRARFPAVQPLPVYRSPAREPRVNMVTDSVNAGSLFGGVGTAITLSALLARAQGARLRIVTRHREASRGLVQQILRCNGVDFDGNIDFACIGFDGSDQLDVGAVDRFITTSWWTTASVLGSIPVERVDYLLQEDERMFYPHGDEWLRCSELLARGGLRCIVNTKLLHQHLCVSGLPRMAESGLPFEPAFPEELFHHEKRDGSGKRVLFFYARPYNDRNLFYRGLEALDQAVLEGVVDPTEWEVVFAGHELPGLRLGGRITPRILGKMGWREYAAFIRKVDLGFCLMATPHPSYPPLDLAASGAAVLTNRFGAKQDLSGYSRNIQCADLDLASLVAGLRDSVRRACDDGQRLEHYRGHGIERSWTRNLAGVVERLAEGA